MENYSDLLSNKKNIDCTGIDFSERAVNLTKDKGINAEVFDIFKDDYKILGDFDYITMFEVLEHIPNAEEAMFRIKDAFKSKIAFFQYQTQAHYMIELDC
jgi:2-polyprenyl-3-methyl-5-hydroxy-6-metoxy-1,4-benzoquinol methylase